jgi:hypothetical protein
MAGTNGTTPEPAADLSCLVDCICPDGGHGAAGDTITFRPTLGYTAVRAVRYAGAIAQEEDPEASIASLMAVMNEGFILHGVESWTLRDKGTPVPVEAGAIRRLILANTTTALIVGDYADALYQPQVLLPLAALAARSLQRSQTDESTSPPSGGSSTSLSPDATEPAASSDEPSIPSATRPKRSRRSSTTSTRTDYTEPITSGSDGAFTS